MTRVEKIILRYYLSNNCDLKLTAQYLNETTDISYDEYCELEGCNPKKKVEIIINSKCNDFYKNLE